MNKKTRTAVGIAAGAGLAISGAALAVGALYTEVLTTVVARRRTPYSDAIVAMVSGHEPQPLAPEMIAKAQELKDAPTETIAIRSRDGYVLRAHWYPVENARRAVIMVHGRHSDWSLNFSEIAPFLRENGCSLLFVDLRSHGESGGDLISFGINERYDILLWLKWLKTRHPDLPVYLWGFSMGASTVLMTASMPISKQICGIIADSGYSTPYEMVKLGMKKNVGKLTAPTLAAVNLNCKLRGGFTFKDYSPVQAMVLNKDIPCLFIHGDADTVVPWRMSVENFYACQAPKDLLTISGAEHGKAFSVDPTRYRKKVLEFFAAYDPPPPLPPPTIEKKRGFGRKRGKA